MWVTPQLEQRARRGRNRHRNAPSPRTTRARPCPHGTNPAPHPGQANNAEDNLTSTSAGSLPTVSTASPHATGGPPGDSGKRRSGGPPTNGHILTVSSHTNISGPPTNPQDMLMPNGANRPLCTHTE